MTFRHVKFQDSPVMRQLERVAREKGLIKDDPSLLKTASAEKKSDYSPSSNLMENVIKLCAGLRDSGFEKYANDLESKFIDYKKAASLYETSKETGDDLIEFAHPDGSHKVSGVEGDAVVETILDEHIKLINIVNKKPTGKLATNLDILKAVKKVVAQKISLQDSLKAMSETASQIDKIYKSIGFFDKPLISSAITNLISAVNEAVKNPTEENLNMALIFFEKAGRDVFSISLSSPKDGEYLVSYFKKLEQHIKNAIKELKAPSPVEQKALSKVDEFKNKIKEMKRKLNSWEAILPLPNKPKNENDQALKWIQDKRPQITGIEAIFDSKDPEVQADIAETFLIRLKGIENARDAQGFDDSFSATDAWFKK